MGVAQYHAQHVQVQKLHSARHVTQHKHTTSRVSTDTPLYTGTRHRHTASRALHSTRRVTQHTTQHHVHSTVLAVSLDTHNTASRACNDTPQYTPCHSTHTAHHHVSATTPGPQQFDVQPLTLIINSGTQSQTAITHWQRNNQQRVCTAAYSTESVKQTMRFTRNDTASAC